MKVTDMFIKMVEEARRYNCATPIIETDLNSAFVIAEALSEELGCHPRDLGPMNADGQFHYIVQFDGVKVVTKRVQPYDLYREHFGVLADIWGDEPSHTTELLDPSSHPD